MGGKNIVRIRDFDLQKIADSGQCFRMRRLDDGSFSAIAGNRFIRIIPLGGDEYAYSCTKEQWQSFWADYFDLQTDYAAIHDALRGGDAFVRTAAEFSRGIRILRQGAFEVMVSFVISQRKSIASIRQAIEALCRACGTPFESPMGTLHAFPTPLQLSSMAICDVRSCGVGYRDKYLCALSGCVANGEVSIEAIRDMDDADAKRELMRIPGIGEKVADCILLFGFHRRDAFPVDVWIRRVLDNAYGGEFPVNAYPGIAGIVQQYLFHYARSTGFGREKPRARQADPDEKESGE
jgi:N-glycosylase/DNA lyase